MGDEEKETDGKEKRTLLLCLCYEASKQSNHVVKEIPKAEGVKVPNVSCCMGQQLMP